VQLSVNDSAAESHKETLTYPNVVPDVITLLAQNDVHTETIHGDFRQESASKSASRSDNTQQNMVSDDGEEPKISDRE
jgi:hypothetical protein